MERQRNVGLQTVQQSRTYKSPKAASFNLLEKDEFNNFFYTPRTLLTLLVFIGALNAVAYGYLDALKENTKAYFYDAENPDIFENHRWPILFACLTVIGFSVTQFPDTQI